MYLTGFITFQFFIFPENPVFLDNDVNTGNKADRVTITITDDHNLSGNIGLIVLDFEVSKTIRFFQETVILIADTDLIADVSLENTDNVVSLTVCLLEDRRLQTEIIVVRLGVNDRLKQRLGIHAHAQVTTDAEALIKAIEEDDSFYEQEALEKGITVEALKEIKKMGRENATLKKQMDELNAKENADRQVASWMQEAESVKAIYPNFDLGVELQNPRFIDLLNVPGVDVRTAFELTHKDDIIAGAMQFTAKTVEKKLADKVMANGSRPAENGMNSQAASLTKSDVSQLSKEDILDIQRRVARGERIDFTR